MSEDFDKSAPSVNGSVVFVKDLGPEAPAKAYIDVTCKGLDITGDKPIVAWGTSDGTYDHAGTYNSAISITLKDVPVNTGTVYVQVTDAGNSASEKKFKATATIAWDVIKDLYDLKPLYKKALKELCPNVSKDIVPFVAQVGKKYFDVKPRILFVGKATNGWFKSVKPGASEEFIDKYLDIAFSKTDPDRLVHRGGDDELSWAEKYLKDKNSAFWKFVRDITIHFFGSENWSSFIAYSNLYKFACVKGKNEGMPTQTMINIQEKYTFQILDEEIDNYFKPDVIVFLTSGLEKSYLEHRLEHRGIPVLHSEPIITKSTEKTEKSGFRISVFKDIVNCIEADGRLWISTKHPQGEKNDDYETMKDQIIKIIEDNVER